MLSALVITVLIFIILILGVVVAMATFIWVGVGIYKRAQKEGKPIQDANFPQEVLDIKHLGKKVLGLLFLWLYLVVLLFQEIF